MHRFLRIAGYVFLALAGLAAWRIYAGGWQHYAGPVMFFLATIRVFTLVFPRDPGGSQAAEKPPDKEQ